MGLAWNEQEDCEVYFREVIYPLIQKFKLEKYYKKYRFGMKDETLSISSFGGSETDRIAFVDLVKTLEIEQFFAEEIVNFYGGMLNIPLHPQTGEPIIARERPVDLIELLQNERRYAIEHMLVEGYSPKQISEHLFQRYDMEVTPHEIKTYAKSFFNVKRHDIQRLLDSLTDEKDALEEKLFEVKRRPPDDFSYGERFEIVSAISNKIKELNSMLKKLSGVHLGATFNSAVLEVTDMREMFKDVMVRTHRRFRELDERTEDEMVHPLNSLVNMMAKATDKIIGIDDVLNQKATKTINEEMLEVIMPSLDRIEKEEKEAMFLYKQTLKESNDDEDDDNGIIGLD
jgi:hypothetical protein